MRRSEQYEFTPRKAYCTECGQACLTQLFDFGIGPYEFWGAVGRHEDVHEVSDCCQEETVGHLPDDDDDHDSDNSR